jgi:hypothetical protein
MEVHSLALFRISSCATKAKRLKNTPELKEPLVMTRIAHRTAYEQRPQRSFGQHAGGEIVRESAFGADSVHFSELVGTDRLNLGAHEGRQRKNIVQIPDAKQIELVSAQFV